MGWCSGTSIFDSMMEIVLEYVPEDKQMEVAEKIAEPLWDGDWDCESDSEYWNSHLVHIMHKRGMLDDEEYEYYKKSPMNN